MSDTANSRAAAKDGDVSGLGHVHQGDTPDMRHGSAVTLYLSQGIIGLLRRRSNKS